MFPDLFGIEGFTANVLTALGVIAGVVVVFIYLKKFSLEKDTYIDLLVTFILTLLSAFVFAILFENLYETIKYAVHGMPQKWTWSMTFYGGLFGGILAFALMYRYFYLRINVPILDKLVVIAPGAIALGHAIGRLGCFLNGCCYGKETDKWFGILFPGFEHKVIPTQLFEMFFLIVLAAVLLFLAFKWNLKYTLPIYLISYPLFRFIIEFFRDDERGQFGPLSPSQYWSIILFVVGVTLLALYLRMKNRTESAPVQEDNKKGLDK